MTSDSYHDRVWEALPEGNTPPDLALRRAFLLERLAGLTRAHGRDAAALRVLDLGCGEAQLTLELARAGFSAVGVDVAEEPLRRARARHPSLDLRTIPAEGTWPLDDSSFDAVWAGETIEHVADTAGFLSEVRRVLRSGGLLLLSTPSHGRSLLLWLALSPNGFATRFDPRGDHLRFYSRRTLALLLEELGFKDIQVRAAGGMLPGARRLLLASARRARF